MKRANVFGDVIFESLLNVAHHGDNLLGEFGETEGRGSGDETFATADEKFRTEFIGKVMKLKTDGAGREMNFFRRASHARGIHDSEKEFELVNVHQVVPVCATAL